MELVCVCELLSEKNKLSNKHTHTIFDFLEFFKDDQIYLGKSLKLVISDHKNRMDKKNI